MSGLGRDGSELQCQLLYRSELVPSKLENKKRFGHFIAQNADCYERAAIFETRRTYNGRPSLKNKRSTKQTEGYSTETKKLSVNLFGLDIFVPSHFGRMKICMF